MMAIMTAYLTPIMTPYIVSNRILILILITFGNANKQNYLVLYIMLVHLVATLLDFTSGCDAIRRRWLLSMKILYGVSLVKYSEASTNPYFKNKIAFLLLRIVVYLH